MHKQLRGAKKIENSFFVSITRYKKRQKSWTDNFSNWISSSSLLFALDNIIERHEAFFSFLFLVFVSVASIKMRWKIDPEENDFVSDGNQKVFFRCNSIRCNLKAKLDESSWNLKSMLTKTTRCVFSFTSIIAIITHAFLCAHWISFEDYESLLSCSG